MSRGRISRALGSVAISLALLAVLPRSILTEQASTGGRLYPKVPPPDGLLESEKRYRAWVDDLISWSRQVARRHLIRFRAAMYTSGIAGLAIAPALAMKAPTWVPAILGFVTAAGQFVLVASQDQKLYLLCHEQAVRLQRACRDFGFDSDAPDDAWSMRRRYREFRQSVEAIKEDYGARMFRLKGQEPPQAPS